MAFRENYRGLYVQDGVQRIYFAGFVQCGSFMRKFVGKHQNNNRIDDIAWRYYNNLTKEGVWFDRYVAPHSSNGTAGHVFNILLATRDDDIYLESGVEMKRLVREGECRQIGHLQHNNKINPCMRLSSIWGAKEDHESIWCCGRRATTLVEREG